MSSATHRADLALERGLHIGDLEFEGGEPRIHVRHPPHLRRHVVLDVALHVALQLQADDI